MTTILWIVAIFVAAILGFFAAAIAAKSGQNTAYQEGFMDGQMAEQLWLQGKLKEKLNEYGFYGIMEEVSNLNIKNER